MDLSDEISDGADGKVEWLAQGEVARKSMQRSWDSAVSPGAEPTREIPFDQGGALWQWQFMVEQDGPGRARVRADDFAVTANGAQEPQCFPGLSTDGWKYQKCVAGGNLKR